MLVNATTGGARKMEKFVIFFQTPEECEVKKAKKAKTMTRIVNGVDVTKDCMQRPWMMLVR